MKRQEKLMKPPPSATCLRVTPGGEIRPESVGESLGRDMLHLHLEKQDYDHDWV